jgi:hypothetical protein
MFAMTAHRPLVGRVLVLSAVALILGGLSAHPAAAISRAVADMEADNSVALCKDNGGVPEMYVDEDDQDIHTTCADAGGGVLQCDWEAAKNYESHCFYTHGVTRPPGNHLPVGGGTADDGQADAGANPGGATAGSTDPGESTAHQSPPLVSHRHHPHHGHHRHHR